MDLVPNSLNTTTVAISLISLLIFLACYLFLFRSSYKVGHGREPPMAKGAWPIIGHLMLLGGTPTPHKTLGALAENYGPLFTIKLGSKRALVLCNWEMAKECYTKNDMVVSSRSKLVAIEHVAYNQANFGFAPYGPFWREIRKIVTMSLSNRHVELQSRVRVTEVKTCIKELYDVWSTKKNESGYVLVEMKQWFTELVFNVVFQTMAGKRYFGSTAVVNEKEAQKCVKALRDFMHSLGVCTVADAVPLLRWMNYGVRAMKETAKELDVILDEWMVEHREKRGSGEKVDESDHQDFMDMMLSVVDGGATIGGFDASTINKATTLALILGATDTSTVTLTWVICLLLKNPDALKKAKEELNSQIGVERFINESDVNKLAYLQAIVKETLRLYPPGPLSAPREFTEDCTLGGYYIRKGTRLITNLWKIHTDPNIWPDPLEFKPERFLTTHKEVDVRGHHFELLPFGSGRRICPGISFGLHMIHLTLANFLHSFEILGPSNEPIDMNENLVMTNEKATPLEIMVKPCLSPKYYTNMSSEC